MGAGASRTQDAKAWGLCHAAPSPVKPTPGFQARRDVEDDYPVGHCIAQPILIGLASMDTLTGVTALVTGASRGIGEHLARELARQGANLVLAARSETDLKRVERSVATGHRNTRVVVVPTDVAHESELKNLVARAEAELGPVDLLVNNAGTEQIGHFETLDPDAIERVVAVNLTAALTLTRLVLPGMLARGRGHIVNMASVAGLGGTGLQRAVLSDQARPGRLHAFASCFAPREPHPGRGLGDLPGLHLGDRYVRSTAARLWRRSAPGPRHIASRAGDPRRDRCRARESPRRRGQPWPDAVVARHAGAGSQGRRRLGARSQIQRAVPQSGGPSPARLAQCPERALAFLPAVMRESSARAREQEPLDEVAPQLDNRGALLERLDPFGHHQHPHVSRERRHGLDELLLGAAAIDVADERDIELDELGL